VKNSRKELKAKKQQKPFRCHTQALGKLFTHMFTKQYKLIPTEDNDALL